MLYREIKIATICVLLIFCSCKRELTKEEELLMEQKEAEVSIKTRIRNYAFSRNIVGGKEYDEVVKNANDSLKNWIANDLPNYRSTSNGPYQIDTLFCFNGKKNKCVSCIISKEDEDSSPNLQYFYGVKIKSAWYFFSGPTVVLPRDYYYPETFPKPFTFDELHNIAGRVGIYKNYLKQREGSLTYEINDIFFSDITSRAYCGNCKTQEEYDAYFLTYIRANWISKYKPLKEGEIVYKYDRVKKTMKLSFSMHYPTFPNIGINAIDIDYWKTLPSDKETALLEKENGWESWYPEYDRSETVESGEIKNRNIKNYSKLLVGIEPNTSYTMRIVFRYYIVGPFDDPVYVTHFTAK